jgi:hypothetical protein
MVHRLRHPACGWGDPWVEALATACRERLDRIEAGGGDNPPDLGPDHSRM